MAEFQLNENQSVPMDHKRSLEGERFEYRADLPLDEQPEEVFNIKTGFTTEVVRPTYGVVRD